jgi:DNA invertase Pin-like site-specific DNA recombinase
VTDDLIFRTQHPDDPSRKLIRQVLGAVAEYERAMISLRLRLGRKRKSEVGGFAYGSPPFGYRAESKALVENSEEKRAISMMVELRRQDESLPAICRELHRRGHAAKRGGPWHPTTVARVLQRAGVS